MMRVLGTPHRAVQEHAASAFKGLKNVECRTFHSLAYGGVG